MHRVIVPIASAAMVLAATQASWGLINPKFTPLHLVDQSETILVLKLNAPAEGVNPPFAVPGKGDYHLAKSDPKIVDAGLALKELKFDGFPEKWPLVLQEFVPPNRDRPRPITGLPDPGAFELSADKTGNR